MASLKLQIESLEGLDDSMSGLYRATDDGKFVLNVEGLEDTTNLKSALQKERAAAAAAAKELAKWKASGKTPDEISALLEAQRVQEEEAARKAGNFDTILQQHKSQWATREKELLDAVNAATASERSAVVGTSVLGALTKAGATAEGSELLPNILANRIEFETVDGKRVLKILQADGKTVMAGSGADGTATIEDLVKEATTKYPSLFKGSGAGGGGKNPDVTNPGGSGVTKKSDFKTEKQRAEYFEKYGEAAYNALPN